MKRKRKPETPMFVPTHVEPRKTLRSRVAYRVRQSAYPREYAVEEIRGVALHVYIHPTFTYLPPDCSDRSAFNLLQGEWDFDILPACSDVTLVAGECILTDINLHID
jgi:hypothetical protein